MFRQRGILVVVCMFILTNYAFAQNSAELLQFYDNELIKVNYQTFGGMSLGIHGLSSSTQMGITKSLKEILGTYSDSKEAEQKYSKLNTIANILLWGGLAATLGGAYYPLLALSNSTDTDSYFTGYKTSVYIMLGGVVTSSIGSIMLPISLQELLRSANLYNRNKIEEYLRK